MQFPARFLQNTIAQNHLSELRRQLPCAKIVQIAVAFVSESGAKLLLESLAELTGLHPKISVFASIERAVSEPKGLFLLYEYALKNPNFALFLIGKSTDDSGFFHSKIYYFKKQEESVFIVGSANLTKGGLVENSELSTVFTQLIASRLDTQATDFFDKLLGISAFASVELLDAYAAFFERENKRKISFEIDAHLKQLVYNQVIKHKNFTSEKWRIHKQKLMEWLDDRAQNKRENTPENFELPSISLHLKSEQRPLIRFAQHHQLLQTDTLFRSVLHENKKLQTPLSIEQITIVLHIYQPRRFAIINNDFLFALRNKLGMNPPSLSDFAESNYAELYTALCSVLIDLKREWKLKTLSDFMVVMSYVRL